MLRTFDPESALKHNYTTDKELFQIIDLISLYDKIDTLVTVQPRRNDYSLYCSQEESGALKDNLFINKKCQGFDLYQNHGISYNINI